jgi:hypothetical protein
VILVGKTHDVRPFIEDAMTANPHGAGLAWHTTTGGAPFRWRKGYTEAEEVLEALDCLGEADVVFHARIGTAGHNGPELTHPFPVETYPSVALSGETDMLLFQNGHLSNWEDLVDGKPHSEMWSDTRAIAHALSTGRIALGADIGSKLLVMHAMEGTPGYIAYGSGWTRIGNGKVLASNDNFLLVASYYRTRREGFITYSTGARSVPAWGVHERREKTKYGYRYPRYSWEDQRRDRAARTRLSFGWDERTSQIEEAEALDAMYRWREKG